MPAAIPTLDEIRAAIHEELKPIIPTRSKNRLEVPECIPLSEVARTLGKSQKYVQNIPGLKVIQPNPDSTADIIVPVKPLLELLGERTVEGAQISELMNRRRRKPKDIGA